MRPTEEKPNGQKEILKIPSEIIESNNPESKGRKQIEVPVAVLAAQRESEQSASRAETVTKETSRKQNILPVVAAVIRPSISRAVSYKRSRLSAESTERPATRNRRRPIIFEATDQPSISVIEDIARIDSTESRETFDAAQTLLEDTTPVPFTEFATWSIGDVSSDMSIDAGAEQVVATEFEPLTAKDIDFAALLASFENPLAQPDAVLEMPIVHEQLSQLEMPVATAVLVEALPPILQERLEKYFVTMPEEQVVVLQEQLSGVVVALDRLVTLQEIGELHGPEGIAISSRIEKIMIAINEVLGLDYLDEETKNIVVSMLEKIQALPKSAAEEYLDEGMRNKKLGVTATVDDQPVSLLMRIQQRLGHLGLRYISSTQLAA